MNFKRRANPLLLNSHRLRNDRMTSICANILMSIPANIMTQLIRTVPIAQWSKIRSFLISTILKIRLTFVVSSTTVYWEKSRSGRKYMGL